MINFEKKLKAELQKKDKDTIIDLYLQKCYEFELEKTQFQQQLDNAKSALDKQKEMSKDLKIAEQALELACEKCPMVDGACECPPTYYDASREYGCDEPYYIKEEYCEANPEDCLNCLINFFKNKAKKELGYE